MRAVVVVMLVAGCDLQPPKKEPPLRTARVAVDAAPAVVAVDAAPLSVDAAPPVRPIRVAPDAMLEISAECEASGTKFAETFIATTTDVAERSVLEHERQKLVRSMEEQCVLGAWDDARRACVEAATTRVQLEKCIKK